MKKALVGLFVALIIMSLCSCLSPAEKEEQERKKREDAFIAEFVGTYQEEEWGHLKKRKFTFNNDGTVISENDEWDPQGPTWERENYKGLYKLIEEWNTTDYIKVEISYYYDEGRKEDTEYFHIKRTQDGELYLEKGTKYYYRVKE